MSETDPPLTVLVAVRADVELGAHGVPVPDQQPGGDRPVERQRRQRGVGAGSEQRADVRRVVAGSAQRRSQHGCRVAGELGEHGEIVAAGRP